MHILRYYTFRIHTAYIDACKNRIVAIQCSEARNQSYYFSQKYCGEQYVCRRIPHEYCIQHFDRYLVYRKTSIVTYTDTNVSLL